MFIKRLSMSIFLTALYIPYAFAAVVSLYIADETGAPYTADPIGTDQSGHTTWRLGIGAASGTFTATQGAGTPVTLVEGATDLHIFGGDGSASARVDCALATPTASGGAVAASCAIEFVDGSRTVVQSAPPVTLTPVPVQVSDKSKSNGAGSLRLSLGGLGVSVLAILGTASAMLVRV